MAKRKRNPASQEVIKHLFENYEIKTALDVQETLKDMFAGTLEEMLTAELDDYLGYDKHDPVEEKVLSMYAKGRSQRDISATIHDIYGIDVSHETISKITDKVIPMVQEFRNRPLKKCYPFVFVDAIFVPVKTESGSGQKGLYNMIGIDVEGKKDVLGF